MHSSLHPQELYFQGVLTFLAVGVEPLPAQLLLKGGAMRGRQRAPPLLSSLATKVRQGRIPELGSSCSPVHIKEVSNESSCWSSPRRPDPHTPRRHPDSITACSSSRDMSPEWRAQYGL